MKVLPHSNLTVTLLRRHLYGTDRLKGQTAGRALPAHVLHGPAQCRMVPRSKNCQDGRLYRDSFEPQPFPYDIVARQGDALLPRALPGVLPGVGVGADNGWQPLIGYDPLNYPVIAADKSTGQLIDVMA